MAIIYPTNSYPQAIPERYSKYNLPRIDEYFAMGRGLQKPDEGIDVPSLVCRNLLSGKADIRYLRETL
jgi:hypothetical protein